MLTPDRTVGPFLRKELYRNRKTNAVSRLRSITGKYLSFASFHLFAAVTAFHFATVVGCGDPAPTDAEQVNVVIANLSEAALDRESFESFFVAGSAPRESQRRRYREYFYEMDSPTVSGSSATASVRILNAAGEVLDEREWSFSTVDGRWKINTAPLP